jgi:hypothetical protein
MNTDLTFFTNEADATLLNRFRAKLRDVQFFDVLAGFSAAAGFMCGPTHQAWGHRLPNANAS